MAAYVGLLVYLLWLARVWSADLRGTTIFWFFGPATVLLFKVSEPKGEPRFFRHTVLSLFSLTVVFEFLINVYPLSLVAELALVPVFVLLGGLVAVAASRTEYRQVKTILAFVTTSIGLAFFTYALYRIAKDPRHFATLGTAREFVVPLILTVGLVPFIYGAAVLFAYGTMLAMLRWKLDDDDLYRYARRRALLTARLRLRTVRRFGAAYPAALVDSSSRREVDQAAIAIRGRARGRTA